MPHKKAPADRLRQTERVPGRLTARKKGLTPSIIPIMIADACHEDSSSWECGLAMIALASVIASPLLLLLRCLSGTRLQRFLVKEVTKNPQCTSAATRLGRLPRQELASPTQYCRQPGI
jgi:hypothetical protein